METATNASTNNIIIHSASPEFSETQTTGDTTANNNNYNTENGPRLFFHVGPIKTGSTSIQCNLLVNPFLNESSYQYLGKNSQKICPPTTYPHNRKHYELDRFINNLWRGKLSTPEKTKKYAPQFTDLFQTKFNNGVNTILSGEEACLFLEYTDFLQNFATLLNGIPQQVTFQVVYRHFFEWSLSVYQYHEISLKGRASSMEKTPMESILDQSAKNNFLQSPPPKCSPHKLWRFLQEQLLPLLDRGSMEVFNFHGDTGEQHDLGTRYICNLPNAQVACQKSKEQLQLGKANPTNTAVLHADRIATAAWNKQLFKDQSGTRTKRGKVCTVIIHRIASDLNWTFPESQLECLSEQELSQSLDLSISIGKEMLGNNLDVEALRSKFLLDKSKRKFCSVNTTAVLEDPGWIEFLRGLTI